MNEIISFTDYAVNLAKGKAKVRGIKEGLSSSLRRD